MLFFLLRLILLVFRAFLAAAGGEPEQGTEQRGDQQATDHAQLLGGGSKATVGSAATLAALASATLAEGGRVALLKAASTEWPPMAALGRSGDPSASRANRSLIRRSIARARPAAPMRAAFV